MKAQTLDLEQGSREWVEARRNYFCASEAPAVMEVSKYEPKNPIQLARKKLGFSKPDFVNNAMKEGHRLEPIIRQQVEDQTGIGFMPAVMVKDKYLASLDGINFYGDVILEIKAPATTKDTVKLAMDGRVALPYQYQIQHQLMVSGADKCIYAVRNPEDHQVYYFDVFPDQLMQQKLAQAWADFEPLMNLNEDELKTSEPLPADLAPMIDDFIEAEAALKQAKKRVEEKRAEILADLDASKSYENDKIRISRRQRKGTLDKTALEADIDLSKYIKPATTYTVLEVLK